MTAHAAAFEVLQHMVVLRLRDTVRSDSARLAAAIREVATRHGIRYSEVESALDGALAFRRA